MTFIINASPNNDHKWHIVVCGNHVLASSCLKHVLIPFSKAINKHSSSEISLGLFKGEGVNVVTADTTETTLFKDWQWVNLKQLLDVLTPQLFNMLGRAIQLSRWHAEHKYCGKCGSSTQPSDMGRARGCKHCELHFYPKISPCVIGIIIRGDECLLARNSKHPEGKFSTIAGFIEAGETAEEAFEREVFEEVGVEIENIEYVFSQPWPFPGQLMLGFVADFKSGQIQVDGDEIVEAHWYHYQNLPQTPSASTISGKLIQGFINKTLRR